jgi:hypothetical protein
MFRGKSVRADLKLWGIVGIHMRTQ